MFSAGNVATILDIVEEGEKWTKVKIETKEKDQKTGVFVSCFVSNVLFVGNAHIQKPKKGQKIRLLVAGVKNCKYDMERKQLIFSKYPMYKVLDYELLSTKSIIKDEEPNLDLLENNIPLGMKDDTIPRLPF